MNIKIMLLGEAGSGKTTCGLSFPGVELHEWGSTESHTITGFKDRKDILPPVKMGWRECLTDEDKKKIVEIKKSGDLIDQHRLIAPIEGRARARNVARYINYLDQLVEDVNSGKRKDIKAIFLDNWSPFAEDLWTYTEFMYRDQYSEKEGFKIYGDYYNICDRVIDCFNTIDCHAVMSCHVAMALDEEMSSKTPFFKQGEANIAIKKDWQPYMGTKYKFRLKSKFDYGTLLTTEEPPGQKVKYYADFRGIGKARIQPFEKKVEVPKGGFYQFLSEAINKEGGK